jgi:hypothetical protein
MFWDVITEDDDTNGAPRNNSQPITEAQAGDIQQRMNALPQSRPGFLLGKLCEKYGVPNVSAVRSSQLGAVMRDVENTERAKVK